MGIIIAICINWFAAGVCFGIDLVACQAKECIKYEGNEKYHGTTDTPPGWWECENGKPVWRTK